MKKCIFSLVVLLVLSAYVSEVQAVDVKLNSGKVFSGDIIGYDDDEFSIETDQGVYGFPYKMVDQVTTDDKSDESYIAIQEKVKSKQKKHRIHNKKVREREKYQAKSSSGRVEIYVTSWCPYCVKLVRFLKQNNIRYKKYDIERSSVAKRKHQQMGGGGVPVTRIGSRVIRGYNPKGILSALNR